MKRIVAISFSRATHFDLPLKEVAYKEAGAIR
jgi:hypothetical protein